MMLKFQSSRCRHGGHVLYGFMLGLMAFMAVPSPSFAQAPSSTSAPEDPAYLASRQAFEALPELERKAIQDSLTWIGVYNATSGGTFGRQTYTGIISFQKSANATSNGILSSEQVAKLKAAATAAKAAAGFKVIRDSKTGIELGLPMKLFPKQGPNSVGGSRWQSADDKITLDTRSLPGNSSDLIQLYERSIVVTAGKKITYKLQKPDFFVVAGETASGEYYIRYALGADGLRGFTIGYDKSVKADFNRMLIAIANSFNPFPSVDGSTATPPAQSRDQASAPGIIPRREGVDRAKVMTGIRVGPKQILAVGLACRTPNIGGAPATIVKQAGELSLLEVASEKPVELLPIRSSPVSDGVSLIIVAWDAVKSLVNVVGGTGENTESAMVALQPGGRGGLVFDRSGAVIGLVGSARTPVRVLSAVTMPASYNVVSIKTVQDMVGNAAAFSVENPDRADWQAAGAISAKASSRIVGIDCP